MSEYLLVFAVWLLIGCLFGVFLVWQQSHATPTVYSASPRTALLTFALAIVLWLPAFVVGVWFFIFFWDLLPYFEEQEDDELKRTSS